MLYYSHTIFHLPTGSPGSAAAADATTRVAAC